MLVLCRYLGEVLKIGDNIEIKLLNVKGRQARIGIIAPKEIAVHRKEIYDLIKKNQQENEKPI